MITVRCRRRFMPDFLELERSIELRIQPAPGNKIELQTPDGFQQISIVYVTERPDLRPWHPGLEIHGPTITIALDPEPAEHADDARARGWRDIPQGGA